MSEVKIEIGVNLAVAIQEFVKEVSKRSSKDTSVGDEVQKAFGINITKIAKEKILMDVALEKGLDIEFSDGD